MNNAAPIILNASDPCSPLSIPPSRTALLLLDFHKFIIASQPNEGAPVLTAASNLRTWAKSLGMLAVHCLIDLQATTAPSRKMASRANAVRERMAHDPESGAEHARLAACANEFVFYRPPSHVSALGSYGLEAFLAEHGISSLLLAGFSTSGCVINTAKGAADRGFVVTVVEDACGDKSPEVHECIVRKLLVGQAHVVDLEGLRGIWKKVHT
jgi:nicotinamidase-related amidase